MIRSDSMKKKSSKKGNEIQIMPLIVKSATTAGLLLSVWGVGWLKFGVSWVIGASVVYFAGRTYQKSLKAKEEEEEDAGTLARVDELPTWVYFPDVERAEWLNKIVQQMWPFIGEHVCTTVRAMEASVNEQLPAIMKPFKFEEITLGDIPPRVGGVKVYIDNVRRDEIVMDVEISYVGDCDINLSIKSFKAGVKDVLLHGIVRVILRPLISQIPMFGGIEVCFLRSPDLHFDLTNIANILDVPFLNDTLLRVISDQLANFVVLPNFIRLDLKATANTPSSPLGGGTFFGGASLKMPVAVISVRVAEADDLKRADAGKLFGLGKSDPYAQVVVAGVTHSTKFIKATINPHWDEVFEFMVDDLTSQIEIRIYDHDDHVDDDFLGNKYVSMEELASKRRIDEWFKLDNTKTGRIHVVAQVFYLTADSNDPHRTRQVQASNAVLMVGVESAKDLSTQTKGLVEPSPLVKLQLGNHKRETTAKLNTTNPRWNESFKMLVNNPESEMLFVQVQDARKNGEILGTVTYKIISIAQDPDLTVCRPFTLRDAKCNCSLTMKLSLRYLTTTPPTTIASPPTTTATTASTSPALVEVTEVDVLKSPFDQGFLASKDGTRFRGKKQSSDTKRGRIQLTFKYLPDKEKLSLTVVKAADLIAYDKDHFSDPYVNIYLKPDASGGTKMKTAVIKNNLNPTWNESFTWSIKKDEIANRSFEVTVKNKIGVFEKNTVKWMGVVWIDLCNYPNLEEPITEWFFLQDPGIAD